MAKVDVEERAFSEPELKKASGKSRVSKAEVMGYALFLWRDSQQAGVTEASREDIISWLDTDRYAKPEKALYWLVEAGFLREIEMRDGQPWFKISGNVHAVERTKIRIDKARAAASARYNKEPRCLEQSYKQCSEQEPSMPYRNTVKQYNRVIKPLKPPLLKIVPKEVTARDLATALVSSAAAILVELAEAKVDPETKEADVFTRLERELGPKALKLFKQKFPKWAFFTRPWYDAFIHKKHEKFEAKAIRELRALHRALPSGLEVGAI